MAVTTVSIKQAAISYQRRT